MNSVTACPHGGLSPRTRGSQAAGGRADGRVGPIPADAGEPSPGWSRCAASRAYPRGRGGAAADWRSRQLGAGLSPRTRGSQDGAARRDGVRGPIPADAGEPPGWPAWCLQRGAYPRGRGGAVWTLFMCQPLTGLSPRTRGSRVVTLPGCRVVGPIPADAGEPRAPAAAGGPCRAYPRGRGGASCGYACCKVARGLSPRTRGSPEPPETVARSVGPIPADAGEPIVAPSFSYLVGAYPRGRGGAALISSPVGGVQGLSPRTRGSLAGLLVDDAGLGPIPADAGEPRPAEAQGDRPWAYPRGRGGADAEALECGGDLGLSPRTRGSHFPAIPEVERCGPIPADAGEPTKRSGCPRASTAYPRGRGGAAVALRASVSPRGLSPRTRGSRPDTAEQFRGTGPIPADAGEPLEQHDAGTRMRAYPRGRGGAS